MGEAGKMAKPCMGLVLVEFGYEYKNQDGCMVSIKPNERYTLLSKTNDHWWHVRKDEYTKPFYIPAKYVKELPSSIPSPLDFADVPAPKPTPPSVSDLTEKAKPNEVTIRTRSPMNHRKTDNRMSTFGVPLDIHESQSFMYGGLADPILSLHPVSASEPAKNKRLSLSPNIILGSLESSQKPRAPSLSPAEMLLRQVKPVEPPVLKNLIDTRPQGLVLKPEPLIEPEEDSSQEQTPSSDFENIYESISDLNLDDLVKKEPAAQQDPVQSPSSPALQGKERENPNVAVYANVAELKKLMPRVPPSFTSTCSSPGLCLSPAPDSPEWEGQPEQDNGKMVYPDAPPQSPTLPSCMDASALSTPVTPAPSVPAPSSLPPTLSQGSDWKQLLDDTTGRYFYYNAALNQTSWDSPEPLRPQDGPPPLPAEDYPSQEHEVQVKVPSLPRLTLDPGTPIPPGWSCSTEPGGKTVFTNEHTHQQWIQSKDEKGHIYYYLKDSSVSQWNLPEASVLGNGVEQDGLSLFKNWRMVPQEDTQNFFPSHRRVASDYSTDSSSTGNSADIHQEENLRPRRNMSSPDSHPHYLHHPHHHSSMLEKAGILNKTKIADNGKKLRKNWAQSWTVLHDGVLTFYKDPKSTPAGNVTKTNQIIPEFTVELKGASVGWATKDKSSKKNVLELKSRHGSEYLIQYDTDSIIHDWHKIIQDTIKHQEHEHCSEDEDDEVMEKTTLPVEKERKNPTTRQSSSGAVDSEQGRVRVKLRKFLQRRPTLQSVKEKGYIKDNVFGCHLITLCHRENTTVPRFVEKCIKSVERRGLNIDGIYRVSGNLAVIQKLRHKADHEEDLDLDDGQWEEIHVITGALKLFFRELPEPLFPFSFFDKFIAAIQISDVSQRVSYMQDLVRALPLPNHNTMEVLFKHLRKVVDHSDSNRMSFHSMAIVFGPTLLRPEQESGNMAVHMVFQNQIVELILSKFNEVFSTR